MKTNLLYSLLPAYFFRKLKAIQKRQDKESTINSNTFEASLNAENVLVSKINKELKQISVIAEQVYGEKTVLSSVKKDNFKILLVEDNEMNRDMLSRRLKRRGYEVVIAVNGADGVEMASLEVPDLILMDMSLPVMDGWEATKSIKATPATESIPIIALTAHAMSGDREKALAAGCDDYDTKPIELSRLLIKIQSFVTAT